MNKLLLKSKLCMAITLLLSTPAYAQGNAVQVYFSYVKSALLEIVSSLRNLNASTKLAILAALAFIAVAAYLRARNTASNNMRRARDLHKKAVEMHEKGNEEEASMYYAQANQYREKAEEQS